MSCVVYNLSHFVVFWSKYNTNQTLGPGEGVIYANFWDAIIWMPPIWVIPPKQVSCSKVLQLPWVDFYPQVKRGTCLCKWWLLSLIHNPHFQLPSWRGWRRGWQKGKVGQICQIKGLVPDAHWQRATRASKIESKDEQNWISQTIEHWMQTMSQRRRLRLKRCMIQSVPLSDLLDVTN